MSLLGLQQADFRAVEQAPSFEVAAQRLNELKARTKKQFRKVALELHPDRTNNDPVKTEDFKLVSAAVEDIERISMQQVRPQRQVRVIHITINGSTSTSASTSWHGYGF